MNLPSYVTCYNTVSLLDYFIKDYGEDAKVSDYDEFSAFLNKYYSSNVRYNFYYLSQNQCYQYYNNAYGYYYAYGLYNGENNRPKKVYTNKDLMVYDSMNGSSSPWRRLDFHYKGYFIYGGIKYYYTYTVHHMDMHLGVKSVTELCISLENIAIDMIQYSLFSMFIISNIGECLNDIFRGNFDGRSHEYSDELTLMLIRDYFKISETELLSFMQPIHLPFIKFWCVQNDIIHSEKYTNSTCSISKDWYIKFDVFQNYDDTQERNVVNYVTEVKF